MTANPYEPPPWQPQARTRWLTPTLVWIVLCVLSIGSAFFWSAVCEARAVNRASEKHGHIKNADERIKQMRQDIDADVAAMWPVTRVVYIVAAGGTILSSIALVVVRFHERASL